MTVSSNEIETTVRKAVMGAGASYGVAEEMGQGAAFLCRCGWNGVGAVLSSLEGSASKAKAHLGADGFVRIGPVSCLVSGPSVFDYLSAETAPNGVVALAVDVPEMLIGLGAAAAGGSTLRWEIADAGGHGAITDREIIAPTGLPNPGADIVFTIDPARVSLSAADVQDRFVPDSEQWSRLAALASRCLVPADRQARFGAGAGDIDND